MKNVFAVLKPAAPGLRYLIPTAPSILFLEIEPLVSDSHCGPSTQSGEERTLPLSEEGVFSSGLS